MPTSGVAKQSISEAITGVRLVCCGPAVGAPDRCVAPARGLAPAVEGSDQQWRRCSAKAM